MNKNLYCILTLLFFSCTLLQGQEENEQIIKPILIDKAVLSGVGLDSVFMKDTPERAFFQKRVYGGKDISIFVVSSQSWTAPFDSFWFDEFIQIFHGQSKIRSQGKEYILNSGDLAFAPKGFSGEWEVLASDHLHYELSVITNKRSEGQTKQSHKFPFVLDPAIINGTDFNLVMNPSQEVMLADGVELDIFLTTETPSDKQLTQTQEQMIHLLAGQVTIEDVEGSQHVFYTGDYFILPPDLTGNWTSQGNGIVKYISVRKSK